MGLFKDIQKYKMRDWFRERLGAESLIRFFSEKSVPIHNGSFWYLFGGLSLFFFVVQMISGILLLIYYSPTPETAHESVQFILTQVRHGWLIRSVHVWSSHLMIVSVLVHMASVYFMKAYRRPRELIWATGVIQLFLVLGFGFTGYLLPWDTVAYFATQIGTEIPRNIPIIGDFFVTLLRGGEYVAAETLKRLFALHAVVLPVVSMATVVIHIGLTQLHGTSVPIRLKGNSKSMPFFPNFLYRDVLAWIAAMAVLLTFSILLPTSLGPKADPYASAPLGIRPEWYFLPLFQTLRVIPSTVLGVDGELLVNTGVGLMSMVLFLIPFLDSRASLEIESRGFTVAGILLISYLAGSIVLAYLT